MKAKHEAGKGTCKTRDKSGRAGIGGKVVDDDNLTYLTVHTGEYQHAEEGPELPAVVQIRLNETNDGTPRPAPVLAVVTGILSRDKPGARFLNEPRGWGSTREEALANCLRAARMLMVVDEE